MLAAARLALARVESRPEEFGFRGPPLSSGQAMIYFLARPGASPRYVAKAPRDSCGALPASAQYEALRTCHAWWRTEDRHSVARPIALLPGGEGFVMAHVAGESLARVLPRGLLRPAAAAKAARAAGDFLRLFHQHGKADVAEVELSALVEEIRTAQASELASAGLALPAAVERALEAAAPVCIRARRARLHGDFTPRNLILTSGDQVAMLDPLLDRVGLVEDDIAAFLAMMSSAPVFASGLALAPCRRVRVRLESAFMAEYGSGNFSPVILGLRLINEQVWRWVYRRGRLAGAGRSRLLGLRAALIDAQMAALLHESAAGLARSLAALALSRRASAGRAAWGAGPAPPPP
ncbi:phosphotransferase [Phenylobacterium sp.]|uniref:phosphotransferase n=1 Tax=Phenylobacterium sp. TaxID=1871053 RepID=UPI002CA28AE1|nr:phosphotransferase [Phenylobacterium sp.]HVI30554.1 phosphotransferase [Phenylobacterium sp.]